MPVRLQPLLLAGGVVAVLPATAAGDAPPWLLATLVLLAALSVVVWVLLRHRTLAPVARRRVGAGLAVLSVMALLLVLFGHDGQPPETYLLIAAALVCSLASIASAAVRWSLQLATVAAAAVALLAAGRGPLDVAVAASLVLIVALLAGLLARELMAARRAEVAARADAERRTELLQAVRDLPGTGADQAVAATIRTLRTLAFDAARVVVLRDGRLREVGTASTSAAPLPRGEGIEWRAMDEDRTIVTAAGDGRAPRSAIASLGEVRSVVATPIRIGGHPAGAVVGGRHHGGEPSPAEVEVAEVLAAHLGVVLDTQAQVRRQAELLERMAELDQMRSGFAREVSSELRDPLTIVRTVAAALSRHGDAVAPERRDALLEQMCDHADDLRRTIDALLDFSRFQAGRHGAEPVPISLVDLLMPVLRAAGATIEPPPADLRNLGYLVEADAVLVRHALEVLLVAGLAEVGDEPVAALYLDDRPDVELRILVVRHDGTAPSTLVRSLVSQLLVAGGAALDDGAAPVVVLRRAEAAVEVST